jgi:adenylate cyclase class IV
MTPELRAREDAVGVEPTISTALLVPAMVRVITGGDPLAAPERTMELIERLAGTGPLVLDTSGVGEFDVLVPILKKFDVHVRVSIDTVSPLNAKVRPLKRVSKADRGGVDQSVGYPVLRRGQDASRQGAEYVLGRCADENLTASIQSVYSNALDSASEWKNFYRFVRDATAVRNWIVHVAIEAGDARARELKNRSVLPRDASELRQFVQEVDSEGIVSLRLTDTGKRPNSVFLIDSVGHLETEGFAKAGKLRLYDPSNARPDTIKSLFHYVDRFGHAARYLNWVDWRWRGDGLARHAVLLPIPTRIDSDAVAGVENELKLAVNGLETIRPILTDAGFVVDSPPVEERDEYFDNGDGSLSASDYVIRLRITNGEHTLMGLKGPRVKAADGSHSRIEIEVPGASTFDVRAALEKRGFERVWYLEKRRETWSSPDGAGQVMLDEVAGAGSFVEIEGGRDFVGLVRGLLAPADPRPESRNYAELIKADAADRGLPPPPGAAFEVKGGDSEESRGGPGSTT